MTAAPASARPVSWSLQLPRGRQLQLGQQPLVMGILNITPDSFSDGGLWLDPERALEHALQMVAEGADLLDLGAESTRPGGGVYGTGAQPVSAQEELDRLLPVLEPLRSLAWLPISVDTRKGEVARQVLAVGADLINDVSGAADPELARSVAEAGCPLVLMHSRGELADMQLRARYEDVVREVRHELRGAMERASSGGVPTEQLILDPGIGFAKNTTQNLRLLRHLAELADLGRPLMLGASRKSFIGQISGTEAPDRIPGSLAATAWAATQRVAILRVHDVAQTVQFLRVWQAIVEATEGET